VSIPDIAITVRTVEPDEMKGLLEEMLGFREVEIAGKFYVIPTDPEHPDFGYCERRIARAHKKAGQS
jgi:hypothetical protein